ncbi:glycosyltransferase family 2 protein [Clostridium formicaceticum]|uniref:Glucosyl-3-phosphoglycerate synthase n=1 Tax=Clostridium formicaceticum TaxID=1497 RepID=A0AAC9RM26_9CLOT|nr:glycosyltransferase family 2 protein [Clostridium formicaceticum]AOY77279.1 glycosyl transferase family 2 [Clostridium formicaceticum]ARE87820.1 Glucosyl-3-phosphoglycerate synthase [Clostridium formicaceticum]
MKVSAIIPAYNEEVRIKNVLEPLRKSSLITNIIVVDDGSKDRTALIATEYDDITVIRLPENKGKAEAIKHGLQRCNGEIILFLDADLVGLTQQHIEALIAPLLEDPVEMTVGIFESGRMITNLAQKIAPNLSGQRAFKRHLIEDILGLNMRGYSLEIALSKYIKEHHIITEQVMLKNISHVMKEEKLGLTKGMVWRLKMYKDILKYWLN